MPYTRGEGGSRHKRRRGVGLSVERIAAAAVERTWASLWVLIAFRNLGKYVASI